MVSENFPAWQLAFQSGQVETTGPAYSIADGVATRGMAIESLELVKRGVVDVMTVNEAEIEAAADPAQKEAEIEADLRRQTSPFLTAEAFGVEDIIDPRETRPYLCSFLEAAQVGMQTRVGPRLRAGVRP